MILKLTIFTPTYNRANLLSRLYKSLCNQTVYDFEWLIIDDGSTDETENTVSEFLACQLFPVRYYRKENGGKHTAHNMAVTLAKGDYFMCLDSDDWLSDSAAEILFPFLNNCENDNGVIAYKNDENGKLLSNKFPENIDSITTLDLEIRYGCRGEFTLIYPTKLLKNNPFPIFNGEKFITECVLYDKIANICNMRVLGEVICVCEYQEGGYSKSINSIMKKNPAGFSLYFLQRIDCQKSVFNKIVTAAKYLSMKRFSANNKKDSRLRYNSKSKGIFLFSYLLSLFFSLYYRVFRNF